jgi:hypothetical protein
MKSKVCHGSKPEAGRYQLIEAIDENAIGIRNELGRIQWQSSLAQRLAACMHPESGPFEHVL